MQYYTTTTVQFMSILSTLVMGRDSGMQVPFLSTNQTNNGQESWTANTGNAIEIKHYVSEP